jgi:uncharacterized protein YdcH (DUF465 family)
MEIGYCDKHLHTEDSMDRLKMEHHITSLKRKHRRLDEEITELDCHYDEYQRCEELKKQRLKLKDEISRCEKELEKL